jgi:Flp pilus assembly CpaE family ATPase
VRLPILTAVPDPRWESGLASAFERADHGLAVVRRCVDLPDLLATAATGTARAVLVSADLRRLDRDALARLAAAGLAVVGLAPPGDEAADRRLRQVGIRFVLPADAAPEVIAQAVAEAVGALDASAGPGSGSLAGYADPLAGLSAAPSPADRAAEVAPGTGRVVAVWGPAGAPGRTTVAVNLAAELAAAGVGALLVDADVYGGAVAQALGLLEEPPGLPSACRQANSGLLDVAALRGLARQVSPGLLVLTGITRADRWIELRPAGLTTVLALARSLAPFVVVDCGFCLERDEELSYDTVAPRRNGATLAVLDQADALLVVTAGDPVGLARAVRGLGEAREAAPGLEPRLVVNKVRRTAVGGDPAPRIRDALERLAGVDRFVALPYDRDALDEAMLTGRTLAECAPAAPLRRAIADLAAYLAELPAARRSGARGGWRAGSGWRARVRARAGAGRGSGRSP